MSSITEFLKHLERRMPRTELKCKHAHRMLPSALHGVSSRYQIALQRTQAEDRASDYDLDFSRLVKSIVDDDTGSLQFGRPQTTVSFRQILSSFDSKHAVAAVSPPWQRRPSDMPHRPAKKPFPLAETTKARHPQEKSPAPSKFAPKFADPVISRIPDWVASLAEHCDSEIQTEETAKEENVIEKDLPPVWAYGTEGLATSPSIQTSHGQLSRASKTVPQLHKPLKHRLLGLIALI